MWTFSITQVENDSKTKSLNDLLLRKYGNYLHPS